MATSDVFSYQLTIIESHLDTFGHVNNAVYLNLFEEARWDLITRHGYGLKKVQEFKKGPVILEVNLKFQRELTLREKIKITTQLISYQGKIGQLEQKILKEDGTVASTATFTFALFDTTARKIIEPTDAWKTAVGWKD